MLGGVDVFYIRGAASADREQLIRLGRQLGKPLWYEQEELTADQMDAAEQMYLAVMLSHDAPTDIARFAWQHAFRFGPPNPEAVFQPSRTNRFLTRLLEQYAPRLWVFGHHHHDWSYRDYGALFVCVGELSFIDIDASSKISGLKKAGM